MPAIDHDTVLDILKNRFEANMHRHEGKRWPEIHARLRENPEKISALVAMEASGGEPDVVVLGAESAEVVFCDCAAESPAGRRSLCYDPDALASRKKYKPADSAIAVAAGMGIKVLSEEQYRALQQLEAFDTKTSSWLLTPDDIRELGGAIFGDRRFGRVFIYHNGAESYYAARGFRGLLKV